MFCLYYDGKTKAIQALNGSGRAPADISLKPRRKCDGSFKFHIINQVIFPLTSVYAVATPGAAAGWVDAVDRFGSGKLSLMQILQPAVDMAQKGFPLSEISSYYVSNSLGIDATENHDTNR